MISQFEYNLIRVLTHSVWLYHRAPDNILIDDYRNGGDPPAPSTGESTASQMAAYIQYLPQLLQTTAGQALPTGQTELDAQKALAPQQQALINQLFAQYAPQLNQVGQSIDASNKMANAQSNLNVLNGPGSQLVDANQRLQQQLDPEYYKARQEAGGQLSNLLGSIDVNKLSGSEQQEVQRSNAQQNASRGIASSPSQTATVQNAMTFGSALQNKRNALSQALTSAAQFLPASQSGQSAFQITTGQPSGTNTGASQFAGVQPLTSTTNSLASNLLGGIGATNQQQNQINADRRDSLDRTTGVLSSLPNIS